MPSLNEIYWVAGLVEGEGCFGRMKSGRDYKGKKYFTTYIQVKMTDKDVIEKLAKLWKRSVMIGDKKDYSYYKQGWKVRVQGPTAIGWMMTLYSIMGKRRQEKIKELLCQV